jgi:hypothetical protein
MFEVLRACRRFLPSLILGRNDRSYARNRGDCAQHSGWAFRSTLIAAATRFLKQPVFTDTGTGSSLRKSRRGGPLAGTAQDRREEARSRPE